jgi:hypothetical protein
MGIRSLVMKNTKQLRIRKPTLKALVLAMMKRSRTSKMLSTDNLHKTRKTFGRENHLLINRT